ncbi:phosphoinositide 3-kinase adapter protein 1 isoform X2 [Trichomycterus rosablanca]|uniref:phosphoinositide 3-kinase adapter protein 1 isoform X2 n=1 Tax=Trichomycterus rosablanca TaxID=2290929 RepID=UPI002F3540B9
MDSVVIVHTSEAQDWATYLQQVLEVSHHFPKGSIRFYLVDGEGSEEDQDASRFSSSKCTLLLLSEALIDIQNEPRVRNSLETLLYPASKVVAFLCGVSERDELLECFENWDNWVKLDSEDEPALYVSTVLDVIANGNMSTSEDQLMIEDILPPLEQNMDQFTLDDPEEFPLPDQFPPPPPEEDLGVPDENSPQEINTRSEPVPEERACLTVQPDRILCGTQVDVYIIMENRLPAPDRMEVEFNCAASAERVSGTAVNEFIVKVPSPEMPAGEVSVRLYCGESVVCSSVVTYYTKMEEISRYLEEVLDPVQFMCQAFNITSNIMEDVDDLLTESLTKRTPLNGLQVFGVNQLEEGNASANERDMELPTLLHFSAKFGLKKLTSELLRCPGALQAYSIVNKNGDYPNTLAEKSGFSDLRQLMDHYVETVDLVESHMEESLMTEDNEDIYEPMANASHRFSAEFPVEEDIYESMMQLNPDLEFQDELNGSFNESVNPEDAMLRKFFQAKADPCCESVEDVIYDEYAASHADHEQNYEEEEEDPYKMCFPEEIYDTIEEDEKFTSVVMNRPPAPVPRPSTLEPEECKTYISTVFSTKNCLYTESNRRASDVPVRPVPERMLSSTYDPYAGMKTPGQRQLISLQERVKVGAITVEEAVQEFKAWQFDQDKRSHSVRFQQENLQKLRDSIIRRQKEKGRSGRTADLDITPPIQRDLCRPFQTNMECSVYEQSPRAATLPPPANRPLQRGTWHTGSTSSTSSSGSNRLSTLSNISYSSGADGDMEEPPDYPPPPPRPPRPAVETPPSLPPPRIPPRLPDRIPESVLHERYISAPARTLAQVPLHRPGPPPQTTRRQR